MIQADHAAEQISEVLHRPISQELLAVTLTRLWLLEPVPRPA